MLVCTLSSSDHEAFDHPVVCCLISDHLKILSLILKINRSLTKEEIKVFWGSKKKTKEEHLKAIYGSPNCCNQQVQVFIKDF